MTATRGVVWGMLLLPAVLLISTSTASAQDQRKGIEFFETKIRPMLAQHCFECHAADAKRVRGGLLLDTKAGMLKGGDTGPAIVPGNVQKSLLIATLFHNKIKMPPKGKLPQRVIADFVRWVKMGAPDPRVAAAVKATYKKIDLEKGKEYWAFQPPKKTKPMIRNAGWVRADIDRFVLAQLEEKGLTPVQDASPTVLVRRLYFDLIGMPPSPQQVESFLKESKAKPQVAIAKVVDELLASKQFGERWGRHWLDVARYAESNGNVDNNIFPHAWRYRDYVIDSFNRGAPYDRFITEQIAGDLLEAKNAKERDRNLTATGFLALTSKPRAQNNPNFQMDLVADQVDVTTRSFLGMTVMCARCHDHKFDPIPTKDYYSLAGIFSSSTMRYGTAGRRNRQSSGGLVKLSNGAVCMGVQEGRASDTQVCLAGDSRKRGETAPRGFLRVAINENTKPVNKKQSGRLELAKWITQPDNPLTARVAANRIWSHLFGRGIVPSTDNFGKLGEMPTNQALLDHLAIRFIENDWSVKKMIREIILTRSYQMSSAHHAANYQKDPDNIHLWRMSRRRLEAEAIRDAILTASGQIELQPPGKSLLPAGAARRNRRQPPPRGNAVNFRSVYLPIIRNGLPEELAVFDVADPSLVVGKREVTTVPAQALYLMNSPWVLQQSKSTAKRILASKGMEDAERVDFAYKLALARPATDSERERAIRYIRDCTGDLSPENAWGSLVQVLFCSAEFRYVE